MEDEAVAKTSEAEEEAPKAKVNVSVLDVTVVE